jgi:hypothetical protein
MSLNCEATSPYSVQAHEYHLHRIGILCKASQPASHVRFSIQQHRENWGVDCSVAYVVQGLLLLDTYRVGDEEAGKDMFHIA